MQRELEDLRLENRIFKSYYERHASEVAAEAEDDKRKTNRQRRRQLPTALTIEQKVEIGLHEQEVAHKDVSAVAHSKAYRTLHDETRAERSDESPRHKSLTASNKTNEQPYKKLYFEILTWYRMYLEVRVKLNSMILLLQ